MKHNRNENVMECHSIYLKIFELKKIELGSGPSARNNRTDRNWAWPQPSHRPQGRPRPVLPHLQCMQARAGLQVWSDSIFVHRSTSALTYKIIIHLI